MPQTTPPPPRFTLRLAPPATSKSFSRRKQHPATLFRCIHCRLRREIHREARGADRLVRRRPPLRLAPPATTKSFSRRKQHRATPFRPFHYLLRREIHHEARSLPLAARTPPANSPRSEPRRPPPVGAVLITPQASVSRTLAATPRDTPPRERASTGSSSRDNPAR